MYVKSIVESCDTSNSLMSRFGAQELKGENVFLRMLDAIARKRGVAHGTIQ